MRYPLVDGHGNFGSVDGDPPAAYRYTEARMSKLSNEMLRDIEKDTVDWDPNFDESRKEPRVLPSRFPNLLVNGSAGIAVGMATNIPPHNLREVIDACVCILDNPEAELADLMEHIKGPDFPTKGVIMGRSGIRAAYATGRGKITVRARAEFEFLPMRVPPRRGGGPSVFRPRQGVYRLQSGAGEGTGVPFAGAGGRGRGG